MMGTDLVPKENVQKWLKYLRNDYPTLAFKCSTQKKGKIGQAAVSLDSGMKHPARKNNSAILFFELFSITDVCFSSLFKCSSRHKRMPRRRYFDSASQELFTFSKYENFHHRWDHRYWLSPPTHTVATGTTGQQLSTHLARFVKATRTLARAA